MGGDHLLGNLGMRVVTSLLQVFVLDLVPHLDSIRSRFLQLAILSHRPPSCFHIKVIPLLMVLGLLETLSPPPLPSNPLIASPGSTSSNSLTTLSSFAHDVYRHLQTQDGSGVAVGIRVFIALLAAPRSLPCLSHQRVASGQVLGVS
jgi:hypothetical protein